MKTIYKSIVVMIFFITTTGFSQGKTIQEQVIGTWSIDYEEMMSNLEEPSREHLDSMKVARRSRILNNYKGRKITFGSDGSYYQLLADGRNVSGTWQLIESDSQIEVTGPDGKAKLFQEIIKLSDTYMILRPIVEDTKTMTIPIWYFTKS